jgi:hypothetical protein
MRPESFSFIGHADVSRVDGRRHVRVAYAQRMSTSNGSYKTWQRQPTKPPEFDRIEDDPHEQAASKAVEADGWVVSADWPGSVLTVEARGDGNRWDGYAETLCSDIPDAQQVGARVGRHRGIDTAAKQGQVALGRPRGGTCEGVARVGHLYACEHASCF